MTEGGDHKGRISALKLRTVLALSFAVLSVLSIVLIGTYNVFTVYQVRTRAVQGEMALKSTIAASSVANELKMTINSLEVAVRTERPDLTDLQRAKVFLARVMVDHSVLRSIDLLDGEGRSVINYSRYSLPLKEIELEETQIIPERDMKDQTVHFSPVWLWPHTNEPMISILIPLTEARRGKPYGALRAWVEVKFMWDAIERLSADGETSVYVINRNGQFLAHRDRGRVLRGEKISQARTEAIFTDPTDNLLEDIFDNQGQRILAVSSHLHHPEWSVVTETPYDKAFAGMVQDIMMVVMISLALAVLAALAGALIARRLAKPLLELTQAVGTVGQSNSNLAIPKGGTDEVQTLAKAFMDMEIRLEVLLDDLQRSNDELRQFAYVASHDLQEPLRMVSSYMQLLERREGKNLNDESKEFIGYAVDGAQRMSALINDLLAYSRLENAGGKKDVVNVEEVLDLALNNLAATIEEQEGLVDREILPPVLGEKVSLSQVFQNLIGNAFKYRKPDTPPHVRVAATRVGSFVQFSIIDNGIGIEDRFFDRIFVIFQRLQKREDYDGTGIGLAICKRVIEKHGGRIWLESKPNEGSTFHFTLPAAE